MNSHQFLQLKSTKNIINNEEIVDTLNHIIHLKKLDDKEHIKKWLLSNVRKHILHKEEYSEIDVNDLSLALKAFVEEYKIAPPYHVVNIQPEFLSQINHIVDYLKEEFPSYRDLSRMTIDQGKINADQWLKNKISKLNEEEDIENVIPVLNLSQNDLNYTWVNIRSYKGLQRESKMMNHCIEGYWKQLFQTEKVDQETGFYSLRDDKNTPLITLYCERSKFDLGEVIQIIEVKEKNNLFLSNKYRNLVKDFLNILPQDVYIRIGDESTHLMRFGKNSPILSINDYILDGKPYHYKIFDFNEFKDDFPLENLYTALKFKELNIDNHSWREADFFSEKISFDNLQDKKINISSQEIHLSNLNNCSIHINNFNKEKFNKSSFFIIANNIHHCEIILDGNSEKTLFFIKNSSNNCYENLKEKNLSTYIIDDDNSFVKIKGNKSIHINLIKTHDDLKIFSSEEQKNWMNTPLKDLYKRDIILTNALKYSKDFYISKTNQISNLHKELIESLNITMKDKKLSIQVYNHIIDDAKLFALDFLRHPIEAINKMIDNMDDISKIIQNKELFVEKHAVSLLKQQNMRLSENFQFETSALNNKYHHLLENYNSNFQKDLNNQLDIVLVNFFNHAHNVLEEHSKPLNPLFATILKNLIIKNCSQISNNISDAIIVQEKDRIRKGRAENIVEYLSKKHKLLMTKDELLDIFTAPFDHDIHLHDSNTHSLSHLKIK